MRKVYLENSHEIAYRDTAVDGIDAIDAVAFFVSFNRKIRSNDE